MLRSRTRSLASAIIVLVLVSSFLSWKAIEHRKYFTKGVDLTPSGDQTQKEQTGEQSKPAHAFLQLPVLSYEESVERSSKTCLSEGVNFDAGAVRDNEKAWREIPSSKISRWRESIAKYIDNKQKEKDEKSISTSESSQLRDEGARKTSSGGRGIVMAAGDSASVVRARTNIRMMRSYNCMLPVEIFHFPNELSRPEKKLLEELSLLEQRSDEPSAMKVTVQVVQGVQKGQDWKAFHIKAAAIQQSSFDDILYLDTDSYPLRNPEYLFASKQWEETGLMLWPDYTKSHATSPLWRLVGQSCRNEYEGESGQILISRVRHQDLLWVAEYFSLHHHEFYGFTGGDRDSFRAAALLLGKKWTGPGRLNAAAGVVLRDNPRGGGHTMLQADPEGKWMFVHANLIKHARFTRPLWSRIHRVANDRFAAGSTYGDIQSPNDRLGDGVKLRVTYEPMMSTVMSTFEGYSADLVTVEDWNNYEELKGFEEKWFGFGGEH